MLNVLGAVFLIQSSVDDVEDFLHDDLGLLALTFFCCDGLVDGQGDGAEIDGFVVAAEHIEGVSCLYQQNLSKSKRNVPESAKMFQNLQKAQINCIQSMEFEKN